MPFVKLITLATTAVESPTLAEQVEEFGSAFVSLATKFLGLFKVWPLNVFLVGGLGFIVIAYFRKLKRSAK